MNARIPVTRDRRLPRRRSITLLLVWAISAGIPLIAFAQNTQSSPQVLITNANVFDGTNETLATGMSVLVEGNLITRIAASVPAPAGATVIDARGRTLMPGLIDMHYHPLWAALPQQALLTSDISYVTLVAARNAEALLMQGFTTVREAAGNSFGLKQAIDEGLYKGPRIFPAGAIISQTSGHGDYRPSTATPSNPGQALDYMSRTGQTMVADGVPEVMLRVRENLRAGASQIKLAAGGGVASTFDPLDVAQYTFEELKAAVDVAATWNTYVMVHVYTASAVQTAIRAGVKSIEHGQLIDEETARMMAMEGTWLSMQPFLDDEDAIPFAEGSLQRAKQLEMTAGTSNAIELAKKHKVKMAFGTDVLFDAGLAAKQGKQLAKFGRWFTPFEVLKMATHDNAQLLALSGPRSPYQDGPLGVVQEGAYADLILVDGNPLENLDLIVDPARNFVVIVKDGIVYKNTAN